MPGNVAEELATRILLEGAVAQLDVLTESRYCATVVLLLWDDHDYEDDDLLYLVASNRDWLLNVRNAGFEVDEVAQFLSAKIANHEVEPTDSDEAFGG